MGNKLLAWRASAAFQQRRQQHLLRAELHAAEAIKRQLEGEAAADAAAAAAAAAAEAERAAAEAERVAAEEERGRQAEAEAGAPAVDVDDLLSPSSPLHGFHGVCSICEEDTATFRSVLDLQNIEQYDKDVCEHYLCIDCIDSWVEAKLEESARFLCPEEDCSCLMMIDDVRRLDEELGSVLGNQMYIMMNADHSAMHDAINEDPAVAAWVEANAAECPSCMMIIEKSYGCDEMVCHCGERFSYTGEGGPALEDDHRG